jgi:hypothetical protein
MFSHGRKRSVAGLIGFSLLDHPATTIQMPHPHPSEQLILWISLDSQDHLYKMTKKCSTRIVYHLDHPSPCPPWFEQRNVKHIRAQLGNTSKYAHSGCSIRALHQIIAMTEILRHQYPFTITYLRSVDAALTLLAKMSHAEKRQVIVWLDVVQNVHPYTWLHAYDALTNECGMLYPPREEIVWADFKIYDMQTFDRIAHAEETFRPRTCYPGAQDACLLPNKCRSVFKRSHSCGCDHLLMLKATARGLPRCQHKPPIDHDDSLSELGYYRWFHQEYVASLVTFGEFRVFIATQASEEGRIAPYVVHAIRTKWFVLGQEEYPDPYRIGDRYRAVEVTLGMRWPEYPWLSYETLTQYALHTYRQLQASGDIGFLSLNVGGRLDIGVSPDSKGFFVNELTRWYGAHQFAMGTQHPSYDKISRAYSKAFAETLGAIPRSVEAAVMSKVPLKRKATVELSGSFSRVKAVA